MYPQNGKCTFMTVMKLFSWEKDWMERLLHPRLVLIMDKYSEVEQSNLTVNKKSCSTAYLEQRSKKGLEIQLKHWKATHYSNINSKTREDLMKQRTPQKYPGRPGLCFGVQSGWQTLKNQKTTLEKTDIKYTLSCFFFMITSPTLYQEFNSFALLEDSW